MHQRHAAPDTTLQPEDENGRVRKERQVAEQRGQDGFPGLSSRIQHVPVTTVRKLAQLESKEGSTAPSPVDNVADGAKGAKDHERDIDRQRFQLHTLFQPQSRIDPFRRVEHCVAWDDRDDGLSPERLAERVERGDEVNDADHQDALDGTGKGREVQRARVVFLPPGGSVCRSDLDKFGPDKNSRRSVKVAQGRRLRCDGPP